MPRHAAVEIMRANLLEHPAVSAWSRLRTEQVEPERIEILKEQPRSAVYRLVGAGPGGSSVIAKRCRQSTALIERIIYEEILSQVPVPTVGYYGFVREPEGDYCWLFLEDAGEQACSPDLVEHRVLAARWLGLLHISAARVAVGSRLPDRGPAHYLEHLRHARDTILRNFDNPALNDEDLTVLGSIVSLLHILEPRWQEVERFCNRIPCTLVHGDFVAKNLRLQTGPGGAALLPLDWEIAGWGVPAADLVWVDISTYWSVTRDAWLEISIQDIRQLANLGRIFRCLVSIRWDSTRLKYQWVQRAMRHMRNYESGLAASIRAAGWRG